MEELIPFLKTRSARMLDAPFGLFEQRVLRLYFVNYLSSQFRAGRVRLTQDMLQWYAQYESVLGLNLPQLSRAARDAQQENAPAMICVGLSRAEVARQRAGLPAPSSLQKRLDWVARTLRLDSREAAALGALCRVTQLDHFRSFASVATQFHAERDEAPAQFIINIASDGSSASRKLFFRRAPLMQLGMIEDRGGDDFAPTETLLGILRQRTTQTHELEGMLIGNVAASTLDLSDFDHLGKTRDDVIAILCGCLDKRTKGAGLLFYGAPGTGKTEFAALLGSACNARVVFAGELSADHREPGRADRIAHLSLVSAIGQRAGRVIVVVDEADDVLVGVDDDRYSDRVGSKVFVNRMVESCSIPTIWITNHPDRMGDAVIRRMLRAVEFRAPGKDVRRRIIDRHVAGNGTTLEPVERDRLAELPASPAVLASAVRATALGHGGGRMAIAVAQSLQKAMGHTHALPARGGRVPFDPSLSSADTDLLAIEASVARAGPGQMSFLLTGLPGTGKSAFARHLADRLGMEVLEKRASDILGMYVGQSERNIAQAFDEAAEGNRFLIFDEADSLLADRAGAHRSWEVTQVNEMLTWMERHPLPFAATSNLVERLDPAVNRRFSFKIRFVGMTPDQIALAFRRHFNCEAPHRTLKLEPLTPGDFVAIARQAEITGVTDRDEFARLLEHEVALKPNATKHIGFR